jgi:hypothetical protein
VFLASSSFERIEVTVASQPASIQGAVHFNKEPVAAVPVYLYRVDNDLRRRAHGLLWRKAASRDSSSSKAFLPGPTC